MTTHQDEILNSDEENTSNIQKKSDTKMTLNNFLMIFVIHVVLPSSDVYSDFAQFCTLAFGLYEPYKVSLIWENSNTETMDILNFTVPDLGSFNESALALQFIKFNDTHFVLTIFCEAVPSPKFALLVAIPMILHICCLLSYWWKIEGTIKNRIVTLPIFITQFWPQYQMLKLLKSLFEDSNEWKNKLKEFEKNIESLGMILSNIR